MFSKHYKHYVPKGSMKYKQIKCDVNEGGMYWEWTTLTTRLYDGSSQSCKSVLEKFPPETGKVVAESVITQLSQGLGITQPAQPSSLISDQEVLWCMEVIGYGLSLPLSEHDTIRDCVNVYCEWLSALHPIPKVSVPRPILDDPDRYARHIIAHLHNLFVPRRGEGADTINRQAVLCHRVLRTLQELAQVSTTLTRDTWEALLLFLLAINDTLLAPPTVKDDVGDHLCERVLSVLLEVWLVACARCFPAPPLWKTLRELCHNWRHRLALVEQWNRVNLALTAQLLKFLYGPSFPDLKISAEDAQLVPSDMSPDCIAQSWFRFLHMVGNPAALCNRTVISHTEKFLQLALASNNVTDPCHHPCLNVLPQIFLKACRGIAGLVDAFLGIPRSGFVGLTSSRTTAVSSLHSSAPHSSNTFSTCLESLAVDLSPLRPKCNSILHLFGEWLFEAALVTHDGPHATGPALGPGQGPGQGPVQTSSQTAPRPSAPTRTEPPTKRPSSLLSEVSSRKGSASLASLTLSEEGDAADAHAVDNYQAGRAEAVGALCRIFCAKKTGEEILPVYLARFYLTLQQGLKVNDDHECSEVLASILLNSPDLFCLDLDGVQVLLPSIINALELVLPEKELKMRSATVTRTDLRRASIHQLLSILVIPLHFQNLPIKELSHGAPTNSTDYSPVPFAQLKPRLMNMLISALQVETDAQNTQMLLGGLLLSVQDSAAFEVSDQAAQQTDPVPSDSDSGGNLLSSVSAHALFVRATYLVCHRLISSWKTDLNISLAALELLSGLARVNIRDADSLECKRAVKWLCDFIMYQCWRPPQLHSKDLHSTIVAAFNCAAVWLAAHPYLLQDKDCLGNVLEVVELGISGSKSVGKPGDPVKTKEEKELKPASMRVRDAAEALLTVILEQAGAFPSPCGPESLSSLLDEEALVRHCARGSTPANAVRRFRYFVVENSILLALLEEPLGNDEDPQPTVTALIRGPFGRHAWAFQLRHLPRHKSGLPHKASLTGCGTSPGRPVPMAEQVSRPTGPHRYFPQSVDRIPHCKIDKSIPSLDSLLANEVTANEHARLSHLIEKQASLELAGLPSVCSRFEPRPDKECLPPTVCHDFQTARLFLSHFGFLPLDTVQVDTSSFQSPSITALDSSRSNFSSDIEALDSISVRTCDTVHIFYVRSGQKTALEIVENVQSESSVNPHFLEFLLCLGWSVDVCQHPGWTGHTRTSWKRSSSVPPADNIVVSNHGGSLYDGESKVIYWADVSSEIAFVVPSRNSEEHLDSIHSRWYERSVSDSGNVKRGLSADRSDKSMNLRPNTSSWSISSNMEKTRAYSLDLEKEPSSTTSSVSGSAPSSSESRRRASPAHNAPTKVLVVWLESFEDHTQLPLRDLLAFTTTGLEGVNVSAAPERDCFVIFLHALQSGLLRVKLQGPSGRMSLATPLVDGMVASRRVLGPLVRQTALNMCRRRRLDNDSYQPPHVRRRLKVQDIVAKHRNPMSEPHLLSHLFTNSSP